MKAIFGFEGKGTGISSLFSIKAFFSNRKDAVSPLTLSEQSPSHRSVISEKLAESALGKTTQARELFRETAAGMGLPKDILSITLLAVTRFFSIPYSAELIKTLRREILSSGFSSSPEAVEEKAALEADVLARVASGDKGVTLSREALERYSRFFVPPSDENTDTPDREENPAAEELKIIAEEKARKDGLLDILNYLPGKNGQYWLVLPFIIKVRGIELKVYIRLLRGELFSFYMGIPEGGRLIVDVSGPKRQWRCFLSAIDGRFSADIRVYPEYTPKALNFLQKEAVRFLGKGGGLLGIFKGFDEITIRNSDEAFSWVDDFCNESLPYIDKEV